MSAVVWSLVMMSVAMSVVNPVVVVEVWATEAAVRVVMVVVVMVVLAAVGVILVVFVVVMEAEMMAVVVEVRVRPSSFLRRRGTGPLW